jgi:hypothetical protein
MRVPKLSDHAALAALLMPVIAVGCHTVHRTWLLALLNAWCLEKRPTTCSQSHATPPVKAECPAFKLFHHEVCRCLATFWRLEQAQPFLSGIPLRHNRGAHAFRLPRPDGRLQTRYHQARVGDPTRRKSTLCITRHSQLAKSLGTTRARLSGFSMRLEVA